MRKYGIFSNTFSASASYKKQAIEALKFILDNPSECFIDSELKSLILTKTTSSFQTPMTQIYNHLIDSYKGKNNLPFTQLYITVKNPPELFTYDSFTFSAEEIYDNPPHQLKGSIVNLTNTVRSKPSIGGNNYQIDDLLKLHSLYVRALLCESYLKSDKVWLTPKILAFILKAYNMILTKQISIFYHINDPMLLKKMMIINYLFYSKLVDKEDDNMSELIYRFNVAPAIEVKTVITELEDSNIDLNKKLTLNDLCNMYQVIGGDKLKNFDMIKLFKLFSAGSIDKQYSGISLEYPPYWVHQILTIGSGGKHPVYYKIFKDTGILKEIPAFAYELNTTPTLFSGLGDI